MVEEGWRGGGWGGRGHVEMGGRAVEEGSRGAGRSRKRRGGGVRAVEEMSRMGGLAVEEASRAEGESGGRGHVDMGGLAVEERSRRAWWSRKRRGPGVWAVEDMSTWGVWRSRKGRDGPGGGGNVEGLGFEMLRWAWRWRKGGGPGSGGPGNVEDGGLVVEEAWRAWGRAGRLQKKSRPWGRAVEEV